VEGTLKDIPDERLFDAILYMDVIEHIEDDSGELENAFRHLNPGGYLIVLVPAHKALYSKFDKKIGHFRRYNKDMVRAILPQKMKIQVLYYLDSLGCILSFSNKILLKQSYPTVPQIKFWDRVIVPVSRLLDRLSFHRIGKSVLLVAQK
jgi:SAM-dependent methyltransferase